MDSIYFSVVFSPLSRLVLALAFLSLGWEKLFVFKVSVVLCFDEGVERQDLHSPPLLIAQIDLDVALMREELVMRVAAFWREVFILEEESLELVHVDGLGLLESRAGDFPSELGTLQLLQHFLLDGLENLELLQTLVFHIVLQLDLLVDQLDLLSRGSLLLHSPLHLLLYVRQHRQLLVALLLHYLTLALLLQHLRVLGVLPTNLLCVEALQVSQQLALTALDYLDLQLG